MSEQKRNWLEEFWAIIHYTWNPEERGDLRAHAEAWMAADHTVPR